MGTARRKLCQWLFVFYTGFKCCKVGSWRQSSFRSTFIRGGHSTGFPFFQLLSPFASNTRICEPDCWMKLRIISVSKVHLSRSLKWDLRFLGRTAYLSADSGGQNPANLACGLTLVTFVLAREDSPLVEKLANYNSQVLLIPPLFFLSSPKSSIPDY